ncbi:NO-binding membrane sensor protein with MHYT domain [Actinocorallia herbida]|uniref:NO-binding membrane sensor protein with MHYT domain n=1 Tax=Actinocorallia herbida TaxID=58109 RepID=A0A3N1CPE9_9ACTN|nr:MHYT domain-containing protein [Actinocorallia herbida]ROO83172.1 NO-binding membrane sensor protein with MHYT domain [Actinocorallia herbida]
MHDHVAHVTHFTYGPVTPVLGYLFSVLGSMLGLQCTARARAVRSLQERCAWLAGAAVALGGTGIWVMHFVGMLGFSIPGARIGFDVPLTIFSALFAIAVVGAGLFLVGFDRPLLPGGVLAGCGIAVMHYTGMAAMNTGATIEYALDLVIVSVLIAIAAATAALWCAVRLNGWPTMLGASLIMGLAISGMHYTGMAALRVSDVTDAAVEGTGMSHVLLPLIASVGLVTAVLLVAVGGSASKRERERDKEFRDRLDRQMRLLD